MNTKKVFKKLSKSIIATLLAILTLLPASAMLQSVCAAEMPAAENRLVVNTELDNYILNMDFDQNAVMAQRGDVISQESGTEMRLIGGVPYYVTYKKMNTGTTATNQFAVMDDIAAITYPGALVVANTNLANGTPTPINDIDRCNNTLTISGITLKNGETASITVNPQEYSTVRDAVETLVSRRAPGTDVAAKIQCHIESAYSENQISAKLGISSDIIKKLKLDLEAVRTGKAQTVIMNFQQIYYTVSAATQKGSFAFADDVKVSELQRQNINSQNPPAMISSVNYGKVVYIGVTSTDTSLDIKGALEAAYNNIDGSISAQYKEILNKCSFSIFVLGGSANEAGKFIKVNTYDDFRNILAENCKYTDDTIAAPISYTARFLKNGDLATSQSSTDYISTTTVKSPDHTIRLEASGMDGRIDYGTYTITGKELCGEDANGKPIYKDYSKSYNISDSNRYNIVLPGTVPLNTVSVKFTYKGLCSDPMKNNVYTFSNYQGNVNSITLKFKGTTTWYLGYKVEGAVVINGATQFTCND